MAIRRVGASVSASDQLVTKADLDAAISLAIGGAAWTDLTTAAAVTAAGFISQTNWRVDTMRYIVIAKVCWWFAQITRTGATLTAPANGDITNENIVQFPTGLFPITGSAGFIQGASAGGMRSPWIQGGGMVRIGMMAPNSVFTINVQYDFSGGHPII